MTPISRVWRLPEERTAFAPPGRALDAPGYDEGLAEGRRVAEAEFASDRHALAVMIDGLEALSPPSIAALSAEIVAAVVRLVREIAGAVPVDATLLAARAKSAAEAVSEGQVVTLVLHPDDLALVEGLVETVELAPDPAMTRGSVRAESATGQAVDGVQEAFGRLAAATGCGA